MSNDKKTPAELDADRVAALKKLRRYAFVAGVLLAIVCKSLPPEYQSPCKALANFCTGGATSLSFGTDPSETTP